MSESENIAVGPLEPVKNPVAQQEKPNGASHTNGSANGKTDSSNEPPTPAVELRAFPKPDTIAVLEECQFLQAMKNNDPFLATDQKAVFAALKILTKIAGRNNPESIDIARNMSHMWIDRKDLDDMLPVLKKSGVGTCVGIDQVCGDKSRCKQCVHWGKVTSPIQIKGENFIATEDEGFREITVDPMTGKQTKRPAYHDLLKYVYRENEFFTDTSSEGSWRYDYRKKHWVRFDDIEVKHTAEKSFRPNPTSHEVNEFSNLFKRSFIKKHTWFDDSTKGRMNFLNGVLDLDAMEFTMGGGPEYGFRGVLPYDYDPYATCPLFEKFLQDVSLGRQEIINSLLEFSGYSLSGDRYWEQKAMILLGEGSNGKSTFVSILRAVAGEGNYTSISFDDLEKEAFRANLDGSLFNITEETRTKALLESSLFKTLTSGGKTQVKRLFENPIELENRAKIWLLCNEMPRSMDKEYALLRRLQIVPFEAKFEGETVDKNIEKKLCTELPGILNLFLKHYIKMKNQGGISHSEITKQAVMDYQEDNDNVVRFVNRALILFDPGEGEHVKTSNKDLYNCYSNWTKEEGELPLAKPRFEKRMCTRIPTYKERVIRFKDGGEAVRGLKGIQINSEFSKYIEGNWN